MGRNRGRAGADGEGARRWADQCVRREVAYVRVPIGLGRVAQLLERLEDRKLDVRVHPVDQPDATVTEVEDHGILVLRPSR